MPTPSTIQNPKNSKDHLWVGTLVCAIGALFYCYEFILRIIPGALQTELSQALGHISASTFGQLSALYYFAYSPMQLPVGMLMDRFGPRRLLSFACLCCTFGSMLFAYSKVLWIVGLGRFLVGFGSSFAFVGVLSLALHWLPQRYFSMVAGLITTLGMFGIMFGEMKITSLVVTTGLPFVLALSVFAGILLLILILIFVRDGDEYHLKNQSLPEFFKEVVQVLLSLKVWLIGIIGAALYTSLSVFGELWGKTYLEQAHHLSKVEAAAGISILFLGWAVGAPVAGYLSDLTKKRTLPLVIGALGSLICISLILYMPSLSKNTLKMLLFFYGVFSGTELIVFIMAKEHSGAKLSGTVFAVTNMIITLGGVIFQPLVGKLLDTFKTPNIDAHIYSIQDYQKALSILPISLVFVFIIGFFLRENKR